MFIKSLYARNFRNFQEISVSFCDGLNEITGATAQGKTSLLEALYLLITGQSFRANHLRELIRFGDDGFYIELHFEKCGVEQSLSFAFDGQKKRIRYNQTPVNSSSILLGLVQGVILTPDDQLLIKGSPQFRRRFLDLHIAQIDPLYVYHTSRYHRAFKQRNLLLKQRSTKTIEIWEQQMAKSAAYISFARYNALLFLQDLASRFFVHFHLVEDREKDNLLTMHYLSQAPSSEGKNAIEKYYVQLFQQKRVKELQYGMTLVGPQKDDVIFTMRGHSLKEFGSEGQKKIALLAIKLAEWYRLKEISQEDPLLLIDELGSSIDSAILQRLVPDMQQLGQLFITAHQSLFKEWHHKQRKQILIRNGLLEQVF